MPVKAIQLLVNEALPEDIRDYSRKYDKGSINELMTTVAEKYPDRYADIIDDIKDIGRHTSYFLGETLTLDDFKPVFDKSPLLKQMESEVDLIRKTVKDQKKKDKAIKDVYGKYATLMEKMTIDAGKTLPKENNLFNAVTSGARGNNTQLKAIVTSPGVYTDYKGDMIPLFIKNSYGEGLSLPEYLSSVYGVRQSTISSKRQTAKGGGLGKEMNRAALTTGLITKAKDLSDNGIDLNVDDDSLYGRVLARDTAGYPKGTVVDRDVINTLRKNKIDTVIVHSPLATISAEGIPAEAFGLDFNKQLPNIGDHVGLQATTALSEPVVQGSLSAKHTCLHEDTLVRMFDFSTKKIKDIEIGDWVLGSDKQGNTFPVRVVNHIDQGLQPCYEWSSRMGWSRTQINKVVCTEEHKFLVQNKIWSNKQESSKNHLLQILPIGTKGNLSLIPAQTVYGTSKNFINEPWALFIGIFLGDGCRNSGEGAPVISCADSSLIEDLQNELDNIDNGNLYIKKCKRSYDYRIIDRFQKMCRNSKTGRFYLPAGITYSNRLKEKLYNLGLLTKYCYEKTLPEDILGTWDKTSLINLLKGYFITDGCICLTKENKVVISFGSTSKKLLEQIKFLLEVRLGVYCSSVTRTQDHRRSKTRRHDMFALYIGTATEQEKLLNLFGYVHGVKGNTILKLKSYIEPSKDLYKAKLIKDKTIYKGLLHCYDITVDHPDHLFVLANGLITSNSGMYQGKKTYAGLEYIEQFLQSPETFKDRAAVSEFTGKVEDIKPAPQGGSYIIINGQEHYVLPNMDIFVKKGDEVEAGQILSDGLADPEDIVRLRGIGEGRKYFTDRFKQILDESGAKAHRRNVELLARSFVDKVKITDPDGLGDFLPEDVISYNALEANYVPEKDTKAYSVDDENAVGKYLQKPVLHYSIGTKLLPSMLKHIKKTGISDNVFVSEKEPKFEPVLIRLREAPLIGHNDFIGKGIASYQKSNYLDSAITGAQSNIKENLNPYVRMAQPDFAEKSKQTGKF